MSYLYRPTPVFNPGTQKPNLSGAVSGGQMRGYDNSINWKSFFDAKRSAMQGDPWIVRSGTMGSFLGKQLGDDTTDTVDLSSLPLTPYDPSNINLDLSTLLPPDFFNMSAPIAPTVTAYNPGPISAAPQIVSAGGSITSPSVSPTSANAASSAASLISALASAGTSIARAATGQPAINPTVAPIAPTAQQSMLTQAQQYQAQAAALATTNPSLAAQYTAQANNLLAQAGVSTGSWFTQSSVISGFPNWGVLAGGGIAAVALMAMVGGGSASGRRR